MNPNARRGFTLVELLVALSLMALIAVALSGALGFGSRIWETGAKVADEAERVAATQSMLRRLLLQAVRPSVGDNAPPPDELPLAGMPEEIGFWAIVPPYLGQGGLYRFRLAVKERGNARDLVMTWRPARAEADSEESAILIEGIAALSLQYLGAPDDDGRRSWTGSWEEEDALPSLVSIAVAFPEGDRRSWPRLTIAPRLL